MADYLPPVVARLSMDMGDFLAGIAKAKAAMKGLSGDFKIGTDGLDAAAAKVAALSAALKGLSGNIKVTTDGLGAVAAKSAAVGAAGAAGFRIWGTGIRVAGTALHWLISGTAELAAVVIPAIVALGAGLLVMAPAAQTVAQHMQALATATSATDQMFGQSIGSVLGFSGALQKAQDAAQPAVYGILGSALITLRERMGGLATAGSQVSQMFQTFAAKIAVEMGPGGALGGGHLFANMTSDLRGLGQVLGNIGHALYSVANAMPGLAEFLLKGLSGITGFISRLAGAAPVVLTIGIAFEELYRWGGLAVGIIARLANLLAVGFKIAGLDNAAKGVASFATALKGLSGFQIAGIAALAAGIGFLIYKAVTARSAIQDMTDAMQKAVMAASNSGGLNLALNNIGSLTRQLGNTKAVSVSAAASMNQFGGSLRQAGVAAEASQSRVQQLNAGLAQQAAAARNIATGAAYIAKAYGTTLVGAMALADEANVKLAAGITGTSQAAVIARMQIQSLVDGYKAMGQSSGEVGADMTALAIQSGLAATGVSKLNSAWDDFTSNLTGGTSALANLGTDLTSLSSGINNVTNVLGRAKTVSLSLNQFAQSLKSFTGAGATAWTNFNKAISSGQGMLDWLRTAGAEGAVSAQKFRQAGLDMASAFVPLAGASKTAQAELMGLVQQIDPSITTFSQLKSAIAQSGASFSGLNGIVGGATQKMANMQSVAQTLGTVLNSALVSALQAAQVQASGAGAAMQKYAQDLMNSGTSASQAGADYNVVMGDLEKLGLSAQQAAALIAQVTQNLHNAAGNYTATLTVYTNYITSGGGASAGINPGASGLPSVNKGHAAGTPSAPAGWAWVGEAGPELVKFRGGEQVLPNQVSMGYANGTGGPYGGDVHIYLDGRQIYSSVQQNAVATQRRTGHSGLAKRTR